RILLLFLLPLLPLVHSLVTFTCGYDACLHFVAPCGNESWVVHGYGQQVQYCREDVKEDLTIVIEWASVSLWKMTLFASPQSINDFTISSGRALIRADNESLWRLDIDGQRKPLDVYVGEPDGTVLFDVNTTDTPIFELFEGATITVDFVDGNSTSYPATEFWKLVSDRGIHRCDKSADLRPAFLIVLISYAIFSSFVAIALVLMIFCIKRTPSPKSYKPIPSSSSSDKKTPKKEDAPKKNDVDGNYVCLPPLDQTETRASVTNNGTASRT
ncbi:hypothetical protein PFISCL1PPCAC_7986, partial [Pristionchus fissidentatus]